MASMRITLFLVFLIQKNSTYAFELSTSSSNATVGMEFSFICTTDVKNINFIKGRDVYCVINTNVKDNCVMDKSCTNNNIKSCSRITNKHKITLIGSSVTESLDGSEWKCEGTFGGGRPSEAVTLHVNIPIQNVEIRATPTDENPVRIVTAVSQQFKCTTDAGRPSSSIQWYISDTDVTAGATSQPDVCYQSCNGKVVSSSVLLYTGNRIDDGRNIYCTAQNIKGQNVTSQTRNIVILYGPSGVTVSPSTQTYRVAETFGNVGPIICSADDCKPNCTITWSGPNIPDGTSSILHIQNITRKQAGNYLCTASNIAWNLTSVAINVIVQYGPEQVILHPLNQSYTVIETSGIVGPIDCTAACKPDCTMTWNGPNLPDSTTSVLNLINIARYQAGNYKCNATNTVGSLTSETLIVIVHYGPNEVSISPSKHNYTVTETLDSVGPITCAADDCKPNCTITWSGPHISDGTTSVLHLQNIDRKKTGSYICTASNIAWSKTSVSVNVIVEYGPNDANIFPSTQTYNVTETGMVGPINCTADCKPNCTMTWSGPNLPDLTAPVLNLENISRNQAGNYQCTATNRIGKKTSVNVSVIVHYGPDYVIISPYEEYYTVNETRNLKNISCSSDCNPNCTMQWSGPNLPSNIKSVLSLQNVDRKQTGKYRCTASNGVGNKTSLSIKITVNFRPVVNSLFGNRTYHENDTVILSCNVTSVPTSTIKWTFEDRQIESSDSVSINTSFQVSTLNISFVGCLSMGTYLCTAMNIIGENVKGSDVNITCSPRINDYEYNVATLVTVKDQEPLNITAPIIAYPIPNIYWMFVKNESFVNITQKSSSIAIKNRVFSNLFIENVTETDFGSYRVYAFNNIGKMEHYIHEFEVIPKRKPNPPENVTCIGRPNYMLVYWKSSFNGGDIQTFHIYIQKDGDANFFDYDRFYIDPGQNKYSEAIIEKLTQGTTYNLKVLASNKHNFSESELTTCNTTSAVGDNQANRDTLAIGAGTGISAAIIVIVIVTVVFIFIRRRKTDEKLGQDKELIKRSVAKEDESEEDGLKENPLYVSSAREDAGAVYSIVDKNSQFLNQGKNELTDDSSVYTQVIKTNKKDGKKAPASKQKKSSNKDIKDKEIEMGCVYENSSDITHGQADDVYANSKVNRKVVDKQVFKPTKNKDGLIYADLDLAPTTNGKRFVIRGLENRNNYAVIDLTKTAEPLPSDSDNEEDQTKKNIEEK